jgi:hypothetical protein
VKTRKIQRKDSQGETKAAKNKINGFSGTINTTQYSLNREDS